MAAHTEHELIFRDVTVIDGTGGPRVPGRCRRRRRKDLPGRWSGGRTRRRGDQRSRPRPWLRGSSIRTRISTRNLFWDPDLTPSSSFGVTTVVTANCGYARCSVLTKASPPGTWSPPRAPSADLPRCPSRPASLSIGPTWRRTRRDWTDSTYPLNHAFLIGHVPIRAAVMGVPDVYSTAGDRRRNPADGPTAAPRAPDLGALGFFDRSGRGKSGPRWHGLCPGRSAGRASCSSWPPCSARARGPASSPWPMLRSCRAKGAKSDDLGVASTARSGVGRPAVVGPIFDSTDDPGGAARNYGTWPPAKASARIPPWCPRSPPARSSRGRGSQSRNVGVVTPDADGGGRARGGADAVRALAADPEARAQLRRVAVMPPNPASTGAGTTCVCAIRSRRTSVATWPRCAASAASIRSTCCSSWRWVTTSRPRSRP